MNLLALQRDMRAWLTAEDQDAALRQGDGAIAGLSVHINNYRGQLVSCLGASFPYTRLWLGEAEFDGAVATHIDKVPPSSWTLDAYARDFPATLRWIYASEPEVYDLAWLELALSEAFVARDAKGIGPADIVDVDWDHITLRFTPALDVTKIITNAPAIWSAFATGEPLPAATLLSEAAAILVWRNGLVPHFRSIDQIEEQALLWARAGMSFAALCDAMVSAWGEEKGITQAGTYLRQWINDGLILELVPDA